MIKRAIQYIPSSRFTISYILVQAKDQSVITDIKKKVMQLGYIALSKDEFNQRTADFNTYKTGIGTNILLMTIISFIIGLSIGAIDSRHIKLYWYMSDC